jgi:hypothetical protein
MSDISYLSEEEYQASIDTANFRVDLDLPEDLDLRKQPYHFANLTSREDFLVKEHIDHLATLLPGKKAKTFASRLFNHLVDSDTPRGRNTSGLYSKVNPDKPMPPDGLIVIPRSETGYAPYQATSIEKGSKSGFCIAYAVQVGSIIDFDVSSDYTLRTMTKTREGITSLATQLNYQVQ